LKKMVGEGSDKWKRLAETTVMKRAD